MNRDNCMRQVNNPKKSKAVFTVREISFFNISKGTVFVRLTLHVQKTLQFEIVTIDAIITKAKLHNSYTEYVFVSKL